MRPCIITSMHRRRIGGSRGQSFTTDQTLVATLLRLWLRRAEEHATGVALVYMPRHDMWIARFEGPPGIHAKEQGKEGWMPVFPGGQHLVRDVLDVMFAVARRLTPVAELIWALHPGNLGGATAYNLRSVGDEEAAAAIEHSDMGPGMWRDRNISMIARRVLADDPEEKLRRWLRAGRRIRQDLAIVFSQPTKKWSASFWDARASYQGVIRVLPLPLGPTEIPRGVGQGGGSTVQRLLGAMRRVAPASARDLLGALHQTRLDKALDSAAEQRAYWGIV
eukprot:jgi/Mesvir1/20108/Mv13347-RA.1